MEWSRLNPAVIDEFRSSGGKVAMFGDLPVVVLNTRGARTGKMLDVPLITVIDDDQMFLFASNAGSSRQPAWVYNVRAHPEITVEYGDSSFDARIIELGEAEAAAKVALQAARSEEFAGYVKNAAPRIIPVFRISR